MRQDASLRYLSDDLLSPPNNPQTWLNLLADAGDRSGN